MNKTMINQRAVKIFGYGVIIVVCIALGCYAVYRSIAISSFNQDLQQPNPVQVIADRKMMIDQLKSIVSATINDPNKAKSTQAAMLLLGQLRAAEAAPFLVQYMTFMMPRGRDDKETAIKSMKDTHPAVVALDDIGLPALSPLVKKRTETDDPLVDALTFSVIVEMLDKPVALSYVQYQIDEQTDRIKRQRLIALRNEISSKA